MEIIGLGTDITECLRIARMIERHGELFINRVYTPYEIAYCQSRKQSTQHFTGRWAAKEAVLKALGTGWRRGISWRDMEIRKRDITGDEGPAKRTAATVFITVLRDLIAMAVWVAGFAGNTIVWRGERFALKGGKLEKAD